MVKNSVKIQVDGKTFTLMGEETQEQMKEVAAYIDGKMRHIRQNSGAVKMDASLAYVLTSLNVANDYYKEKEAKAVLEGRVLGLSTRLEEMNQLLEDANLQLQDYTLMQEKLAELEATLLAKEKAPVTAEKAPEANGGDAQEKDSTSNTNNANNTNNTYHTYKGKRNKR